jgi:hypothetical protein
LKVVALIVLLAGALVIAEMSLAAHAKNRAGVSQVEANGLGAGSTSRTTPNREDTVRR